MNRPSFDIDALDIDRLEWLSLEDYEPPISEWVVTRWESEIIEGLYAVAVVYFDGKSWYNADGEEETVTEFAEVKE